MPTIAFDDLQKQLKESFIMPWTVNKDYGQDCVKIELYDLIHGIPKYTVDIDTGLQFTVYLFNWPIPDDHTIYTSQKRSIKSFEDVNKLIKSVENSKLCKGC